MRIIHCALVLFLIFTGKMAIAQAEQRYCQDRLNELITGIFWTDFRNMTNGRPFECRKDWMTNSDSEFMACGDPRISSRIQDEFEDFVAARFRSGFGLTEEGEAAARNTDFRSIGLRRERITNTRRQVFLSTGLAKNAREAVLDFGAQIDQAVQLTVCNIGYGGDIAGAARVEWPDPDQPGQAAPSVLEIKMPDINRTDRNNNATNLVLIGVDFPDAGGTNQPLQSFGNLTWVNRYNCGECELYGVADLHVHQMAELAFGGRLMWGSHTGEQSEALIREETTGAFRNTQESIARLLEILLLPTTAINTLTDLRLDANVLMSQFKNKIDDEGFVTVGTAGFPNFEDWPHHADRSHQQVHVEWLEHAVTARRSTHQNLALMVVSLVNNNFLCSVLKLADGQGNVPTTGIVGSESERWKCSDFENLHRQIDAVQALELRHDWYRVALSPWHAEQIIRDDKLAIMMAMESDHPLSGPNGKYNRTDFVTILDGYMARGVRSLQTVHEADSIFCGAALHRADMNFLQNWQWRGVSVWEELQQGNPFNVDKGTLRNRKGLTEDGERLIAAMVSRNLPIDLSHASIACQRDIMALVPNGFGLYSSHTKFEHLLRPRNFGTQNGQKDYGGQVIAREKNFLISEDMEQAYLDHEVMIGLRTASVDVYSPEGYVDTPWGLHYVPNDCPGSAKSFGQMVKYASDKGFIFAYGTDFNTGVSQLGPRFGNERCYASRELLDQEFRSTRPILAPDDQWPLSGDADRTGPAGKDYYTDGLAHIGLLPELTWDLQNEVEIFGLPPSNATMTNPGRGIPAAEALSHGAENFINVWYRSYDNRTMGALPVLPTSGRMAGVACTQDNQCASDRCRAQLGGREKDRVCTCLNDDTGCATGETCATPALGQNFCVVEDLRMVGESCYTDLACQSGRCNARDGREGQCVCRVSTFPDGCRENTSCGLKFSLDKGKFAKDLFMPSLRFFPPVKIENICKA